MADFVQTIETSLAVGSLYALIALGYTMVYGILRFINFAHGDMVVLGAWLSYTMAAYVLRRQPTVAAPPIWLGPAVCLISMVA
jgi:branched-chain amino acid transport system permease protein